MEFLVSPLPKYCICNKCPFHGSFQVGRCHGTRIACGNRFCLRSKTSSPSLATNTTGPSCNKNSTFSHNPLETALFLYSIGLRPCLLFSYISTEICWKWQNVPIKIHLLPLCLKTLDQTIINSDLKGMQSVVPVTRSRKKINKEKPWDTTEEAKDIKIKKKVERKKNWGGNEK